MHKQWRVVRLPYADYPHPHNSVEQWGHQMEELETDGWTCWHTHLDTSGLIVILRKISSFPFWEGQEKKTDAASDAARMG